MTQFEQISGSPFKRLASGRSPEGGPLVLQEENFNGEMRMRAWRFGSLFGTNPIAWAHALGGRIRSPKQPLGNCTANTCAQALGSVIVLRTTLLRNERPLTCKRVIQGCVTPTDLELLTENIDVSSMQGQFTLKRSMSCRLRHLSAAVLH